MIKLNERIRHQRKLSKYTQQEIADILGIARSTYAAYELGYTTPSELILERLARIYDINVYDLGQSKLPVDFINESYSLGIEPLTAKSIPPVAKAITLASEIKELFLQGGMTSEDKEFIMNVLQRGYLASLNSQAQEKNNEGD